MRSWLEDVRFAARLLPRNRGTNGPALLALVLGVGACTAVFSVVHGVLLRALPYTDPDRLVTVAEVSDRGQRMSFSDPNFEDLREASHGFAGLAQYAASVVSVSGGREPVRAGVAAVSDDFFDVVGVRPSMGRAFAPEEQRSGAGAVAVVSHGYWERSLSRAGDLSRIRLRLDGRVHDVVGVMPPGFAFPAGTDVWVPRGLYPRLPSRTAHNWRVLGRLRPDVTLEQARGEATEVARRLKAEHGDLTWMADAEVRPLRDSLTAGVRPALIVLSGAVAFLLLVACANVANLLLAQAAARQRELAVRLAVGAGRRRLVRQLVTEALLLSFLGSLGGIVLAGWGVRLLLAFEPGTLPRAEEVGLHAPVLAFAVLLCVGTALLVGLAVVLRSTRGVGSGSLHEGEHAAAGGPRRITLDALVLFQVAATVTLLAGAGLLGRSLLRLLSVDPGFRVASLLALDVAFPADNDSAEALARRVRFSDEVLARLRALPAVREAGLASVVPLGGTGGDGVFLVIDREIGGFEEFEALTRDPALTGEAEFRVASPGYFRALGIPLLRGRLFGEADGPDTPHVAVISESLARRRWPDEDPLGRHVEFGNMDGDLRLFTIVGVVGDVREAGLDREPRPTFYAFYRQRPRAAASPSFVVRADGPPAPLVSAARRLVRELDPELPPRFRTIEEIRAASLADRRFTLLLLGAFGTAALLLAALGIYGVTSYSVARRTREVGIRMALGARPAEVLGLVLGEGVRPVAAGAGLGILAALALSRLMSSHLFGVAPGDPATLAGVAALLALVALLACLAPARRAIRADPIVALRAE
jgi:predicted permease